MAVDNSITQGTTSTQGNRSVVTNGEEADLGRRVLTLEGQVLAMNTRLEQMMESLMRGNAAPNPQIPLNPYVTPYVHNYNAHPQPPPSMPYENTPNITYPQMHTWQPGQHGTGGLVKLPKYDGEEDVEAWLLRVDRYFDLYAVPHWSKVNMVAVRLRGKAASWYDRLIRLRGCNITWEDFVDSIMLEYDPSYLLDHMIELKHLNQVGTVRDYVDEFRKVARRVVGIDEHGLTSMFIGGLREEIRLEVQLARPVNISAAMHCARVQEEVFERKLANEKRIRASYSQSETSG